MGQGLPALVSTAEPAGTIAGISPKVKASSEQGERHPSQGLPIPCCGRQGQGLEKPCWMVQGIANSGHEQKCHHHHYFPGQKQDMMHCKQAPCHTVRFGFHSNPMQLHKQLSDAQGLSQICPEYWNPSSRDHQQYLEMETSFLNSVSEKPQGSQRKKKMWLLSQLQASSKNILCTELIS